MTSIREEAVKLNAQREAFLKKGGNDVLAQLFLQGPTWDGNLVSKSERDELFDLELADGYDGWQWLNEAGVRLALKVDYSQWADQRYYKKQSCQ